MTSAVVQEPISAESVSGTPVHSSVVAVVVEGSAEMEVVNRAVSAAVGLDAPLLLAVLHPSGGFSSDPAFVAWLRQRGRGQVEGLLADLRPRVPQPPVAVVRSYGWGTQRFRHRRIAKLLASITSESDTALVVAPQALRRAVSQLRPPVVLVATTGYQTRGAR